MLRPASTLALSIPGMEQPQLFLSLPGICRFIPCCWSPSVCLFLESLSFWDNFGSLRYSQGPRLQEDALGLEAPLLPPWLPSFLTRKGSWKTPPESWEWDPEPPPEVGITHPNGMGIPWMEP